MTIGEAKDGRILSMVKEDKAKPTNIYIIIYNIM